MVLICGKTHPFAGRSSINLTDLAGKAFVLREEKVPVREEFLTDLTENRGIPIVEKWICHSSDSIINIVASGQGSLYIVKVIVKDTMMRLTRLQSMISFERSFKIVYHKDKFLLSTGLKKTNCRHLRIVFTVIPE